MIAIGVVAAALLDFTLGFLVGRAYGMNESVKAMRALIADIDARERAQKGKT